jgi:uncharacterized Zn finger protein
MDCRICGSETRILKVEPVANGVRRVRECTKPACGHIENTVQKVSAIKPRAARKVPDKPPQSYLACPGCQRAETLLLSVDVYTISKTRLHVCRACGTVFETDETYLHKAKRKAG